MEETIKRLCEYIEKVGTMNLDATDIDYLYKVVDIYKDLKEVENMKKLVTNIIEEIMVLKKTGLKN